MVKKNTATCMEVKDITVHVVENLNSLDNKCNQDTVWERLLLQRTPETWHRMLRCRSRHLSSHSQHLQTETTTKRQQCINHFLHQPPPPPNKHTDIKVWSIFHKTLELFFYLWSVYHCLRRRALAPWLPTVPSGIQRTRSTTSLYTRVHS